jgi:hypothetical protein
MRQDFMLSHLEDPYGHTVGQHAALLSLMYSVPIIGFGRDLGAV